MINRLIDKTRSRKKYQGINLPINRHNELLQNDLEYIKSADDQLKKINHYKRVDRSNILDYGCGPGRLACCLQLHYNPNYYLGIDVDKNSINWCNKWINNMAYEFIHIDAHNERFNPSGKIRPNIPVTSNLFDIVFINSVFSHMMPDDIKYYLSQMVRLLKPDGILYLTAFIEPEVPDISLNPPGYLGRESTGPLHRVRYSISYFTGMLEHHFNIISIEHRGIKRTQQTEVICTPN